MFLAQAVACSCCEVCRVAGSLWLGRRRFNRIQLFAVFNDTIEGPRAPAVDSGSESLARRMSAESEWMMIGTPWLGVVSTRETYSAGFPKPSEI